MRKHLILWSIAALSLACAGGIRIFTTQIPESAAVVVNYGNADIEILCSGRIEEDGAHAIYTGIPLVIREVYVREGDAVRKGDPIALVDTEETVRYLSRRLNQTLALAELEDALPVEWLAGKLRDEHLLPQYIRSESDGLVRQLALNRFEVHSTDIPAAVISSGETPYVRMQIRESDTPWVEVGQQVRITGTGLACSYEGIVREIASGARSDDSGATVLDVYVDVPEQDDAFRTGLNVHVCIAARTLEEVIVIPHSAVRIDAQCREYVLVYRNGRAEKCMVSVGQDVSSGYLISSGLQPGDVLLLDGNAAGEWVRPCISGEAA